MKLLKSNNSTAQTTPPRRGKLAFGSEQRDIVISALFCLALIVAGFYWVQNIERPRALEQRIASVTSTVADHQRVLTQDILTQLRSRVSRQAQSPTLQKALAEQDTATIASIEQGLQRAFPEAVSSQILLVGPQGIADERSQTERLRNNIEIDMMAKTLASKSLIIEAYRYEEQWLVSMTEAASAQGVVFVTLPASYFAKMLRNIAGSSVQNALIQTYKSRKDMVVDAGRQAYTRYAQSRSLSVPGWTLKVYPQTPLVQSLQVDGTLLWLVCALCLALVSASHAIFFLRSYRRPSEAPASNNANEQKHDQPLSLAESLESKLAAQRRRAQESDDSPNPFVVNPSPPLPEVGDPAAKTPTATEDDAAAPAELAVSAFRAYDIRGLADRDLSDATCLAIGKAIGSELLERGQSKVLLGRDGRLSSPRIREQLVGGLLSTGIDIVDLGLVATPMLNFACRDLNIGNAVMITGSHSAPDYNGIKIVMDFSALSADDIQALRQRIQREDFAEGEGRLENDSIEQRYIDRIIGDVVVAETLKVVVDAGNGATANVAPPLFDELGCQVIPLFCEVDGRFPNRPPDPTVSDNLSALRAAVAEHEADIGLAFDGDGDRLAVVSGSGLCPGADELLLVLAEDMISRNPGCEILFDVKCSRVLPQQILELGGRPLMWKCGHSYMRRKMAETGALLGGEYSGHIYFNERWHGFDDGLYSAARLLECLSLKGLSLDDALAQHPQLPHTPELIVAVEDDRKFAIVDEFAKRHHFQDAKIDTTDGVRAEFRHGWGLIRASNTGPAITLRFEADSETALESMRQRFREVLGEIDPDLANSL